MLEIESQKTKKFKKLWHLQLTIRYYSLILFSKFFLIHDIRQKHQIVFMTFALEFWTKNLLFLRPQLFLKSKTNTNQQRLFSLPWNHPNKWTVPLNYIKGTCAPNFGECMKNLKNSENLKVITFPKNSKISYIYMAVIYKKLPVHNLKA